MIIRKQSSKHCPADHAVILFHFLDKLTESIRVQLSLSLGGCLLADLQERSVMSPGGWLRLEPWDDPWSYWRAGPQCRRPCDVEQESEQIATRDVRTASDDNLSQQHKLALEWRQGCEATPLRPSQARWPGDLRNQGQREGKGGSEIEPCTLSWAMRRLPGTKRRRWRTSQAFRMKAVLVHPAAPRWCQQKEDMALRGPKAALSPWEIQDRPSVAKGQHALASVHLHSAGQSALSSRIAPWHAMYMIHLRTMSGSWRHVHENNVCV